MSSPEEIINVLITNSADSIALNNLINGDMAHDGIVKVEKVKGQKRGKKGDPKKELKIMIDRFVMNLNEKDKDDLNVSYHIHELLWR